MSLKVAILDTGYENYTYEKKLISRHGYTLQIFKGEKSDISAKLAFAKDAVGIFVRWTKVDEDFLKNCTHLKVIIRYGAGYENVDIDAATKAGVKVANVGGYGNHSVSDHALTLMYACARGLFRGVQTLKSNFGKPPYQRMFEFHRKTVGIIGLGRIGGTLSTKAVHLFNQVLACDPYVPDSRFTKLGVMKVSFDELLMRSDVISLHCNLTDETRNMIDKPAFDKMDKIPIIINTSRGKVIETEALLDALNSGNVFRAGLDVYDSELPDEIPDEVKNHSRIIATGHYAWYSENSIEELQKRAAQNMIALLQGKKIEDLLN
jgi:D-3-phosphoglycerate dehydrogenase / 2-oxoglutarate reductase